MSNAVHGGLDLDREPPRVGLPDKVKAVLNGIPGLVAYWDRDLRNHLANDAYVEYFGREPDEIYGTHIRDLLGETLYVANLPYIEAALAGEEQLFDRALVDTSGRTRYTQASYIPDRRGDTVHGFFVLVTDVTARVNAERALSDSVAQYRALARNLPNGFVVVFDTDLRFVIADGPELQTFGYSSEGLEGRLMTEALPTELARELTPRYHAALRGESVTWERTVGRRTFRLRAGPVRHDDAQVAAGMVMTTDVTIERNNHRTMAALRAIATDVARQRDPEVVATSIATCLVDLFGIDNAAVVRFTGDNEAEILAMAPARVPSLARTMRFAAGDTSALAKVWATGSPALVRYPGAPGSIASQMSSGGIRVGAAAPVMIHGAPWGVIGLLSSVDDGVDERMLEQLASFAELLELAIGSTSAWAALNREASTDALTGLPNRRAFDAGLRRDLAYALRHQRPLSVAMLDLDHFKSVNDRFGHQVGDRVLAEVARRLGSIPRESELIARFGGEEFGWILAETDGASAARAAERTRRIVADEPFEVAGKLTISIGVASLEDLSDCPEDLGLLEAADRALYAAKHDGRDRVARYRVVQDRL